MFGTEKGQKQVATRSDQVNGLLDKGCSFEGKLTFDGTVQINGDFKGEVYSDGVLVIGNEAKIDAKIYVDTLVVFGKVQGEITAKSKIEMHVPAVVVANVNTKGLSIEDGVIFEGQCHMERDTLTKTEESSDSNYAEQGSQEESEDVLVM